MITIIFDIDGTLVDSMKFDSELYIRTIREIAGNVFIRDDWGDYKYVTDSGILNQILNENNIQDVKEISLRIKTLFGELILNHLESYPCRPIRGAVETINRLYGNKEYTIGFATGGWRHAALMKLQSAGFSIDESTLFSGDNHHDRVSIMKSCKNRIAPGSNKTVYIGDAEWDIEAAAQLKWGFIGIGEKLKGKAEVWIQDFTSGYWESALNKALL